MFLVELIASSFLDLISKQATPVCSCKRVLTWLCIEGNSSGPLPAGIARVHRCTIGSTGNKAGHVYFVDMVKCISSWTLIVASMLLVGYSEILVVH